MSTCVKAWIVIVVGLASVACRGDTFTCSEDGECVLGGEPGVCVAGNCAYVDAMCTSGYRYAAGVGNSLARECVDEGDVVDSDTENGTAASGSASSESVDESSGPATTSMSTTDALDCTDPSSESCFDCAVGPMGSCASQYASCESIEGCPTGHACLEACLSGMACDECCAGLSPNAITAMYAAIACQQAACAANCGSFPSAECEPL